MTHWYESPGRRNQVRMHLNVFNDTYEGILGKDLDEDRTPVDAPLKDHIKAALHALGAPDSELMWGVLYGFDRTKGVWEDDNFLDWLHHPSMVPDAWEARGRRIRREHLEAVRRPEHIGKRGLALVVSFEGYFSGWYIDPVGVRTVGYGHTGPISAAAGVTVPLSPAEAIKLLRYDLRSYEAAVLRLAKRITTQAQFDAAVSFTYNVGAGGLASSTFLREWNAGHLRAAADALLRWNKGTIGGQLVELPGLTRRRRAERALFLS